MSLLRFVMWGMGQSETLLRNEKNGNVPKDMREKRNERNDCFSRKIEGIRAMDFF